MHGCIQPSNISSAFLKMQERKVKVSRGEYLKKGNSSVPRNNSALKNLKNVLEVYLNCKERKKEIPKYKRHA